MLITSREASITRPPPCGHELTPRRYPETFAAFSPERAERAERAPVERARLKPACFAADLRTFTAILLRRQTLSARTGPCSESRCRTLFSGAKEAAPSFTTPEIGVYEAKQRPAGHELPLGVSASRPGISASVQGRAPASMNTEEHHEFERHVQSEPEG